MERTTTRIAVAQQEVTYGPLAVRHLPTRAGVYTLKLKLCGSELAEGTIKFGVVHARASPLHTELLERPGQYGLTLSARPSRTKLTCNEKGYDLTVLLRDEFGNPLNCGGDEVRAELVLRGFGPSKLAQKLQRHLAPLDPQPPTVVDHGDGSYGVHLPGKRPCRPPKPAVSPYEEDSYEEGEEGAEGAEGRAVTKLSEGKWLSKIVRVMGTDLEALAIIDVVDTQEVELTWLESGKQARGEPAVLLQGVDQHTIVSDSLHGQVVVAEGMGTLAVKGLVPPESQLSVLQSRGGSRSAQGSGSTPPSPSHERAKGPLMYVVDDGKSILKVTPRQLIEAIEAHKETLRSSDLLEPLWGNYILHVYVNGEHANKEVLRIPDPSAKVQQEVLSALGAFTKRLDWDKDWAGVERSLQYRGITVDPSVAKMLGPLVPQLQDVYLDISDRRGEYDAEDAAHTEYDLADATEQSPLMTPAPTSAASAADTALGSASCSASGSASGSVAACALSAMGVGFPRGGGGCKRASNASFCRKSALMAIGSNSGAADGTDGPTLTMGDWWEVSKRFTQSANSTTKTPALSQADIDALLPKHVTSGTSGMSGSHAESSDVKFGFQDFMEGLVMVALEKYVNIPLAVSLEQLIRTNVLADSLPEDPLRIELRHSSARSALFCTHMHMYM